MVKVGTKVESKSALHAGELGTVIASYNDGALVRVRLDSGTVVEGLAHYFPEVKRTVANAITADDMLTALAAIAPDRRYDALSVLGIKILRECADLCGIDSVDMPKRACILAIVQNF